MWSIRLDVNWHFIVSVPQDHCIRLWHYIDKFKSWLHQIIRPYSVHARKKDYTDVMD